MRNDMRKMLRGKIHRATITGADLHYEGSVTIDSDLLRAAGIIENEAVCIWDVNNGERFETYALEGQPGSGVVCVNGAAAHKVNVGDLIIIAAFGWMPAEEAAQWKPNVVFVDEKNRETDLGRKHEIGGQSLLRKVWG
jgi:aspartate 1-decarboxylase